LATHKRTWEKAEAFCRHDQKIRSAYRYSQIDLAEGGVLGELRDKLKSLGKKLDNLKDLMDSEAKLQSQLLDPLADMQQVYRTRYLQAFDEVTGKCEAVRTEIDNLPDAAEFKTALELAKIDALGSLDVAVLKADVGACKIGLFESLLDRNGVERALKDRPQPEGCSLHLDEADGLVDAAENSLEQAKGMIRSALVNMANLVRQPALLNLLQQGEGEAFIVEVLKAPDAEKLANLLAQRIPADPANAKLLAKYLQKVVVRVVRLQDFHPSKATIEKADIDQVVGEFRQFLETAMDGGGKSQSTIVEIK